MTPHEDTLSGETGSTATEGRCCPGAVLLFSGSEPRLLVLPLQRDRLTIGRDLVPDERVSRAHAELRRDAGTWSVRDLGSRNGTFADGRPVERDGLSPVERILRLGYSTFLLTDDVRPFETPVTETDGVVAGPSLQATLRAVAGAGARSQTLLITGESGSGKELAARAFHRTGPNRRGPFVAVNGAAIPPGLAERLLFGARRGAYSGAEADAPGYLQAADGGVLFLDEVAELDLAVQAKLLRVLESGEVLPLGAVRPVRVDLRLCFATHRSLRAAVAEGKFRADLFYRITSPEVRLPPLRERPEEIAALVASTLRALDASLSAHATLIEACLLRPWPGNVRELGGAIRAAGQQALAQGARVARDCHLDPAAGTVIAGGATMPPEATPPPREPDRADIETALAEARGNLSAAARALGLHRTQLYRLLRRLDIPVPRTSST